MKPIQFTLASLALAASAVALPAAATAAVARDSAATYMVPASVAGGHVILKHTTHETDDSLFYTYEAAQDAHPGGVVLYQVSAHNKSQAQAVRVSLALKDAFSHPLFKGTGKAMESRGVWGYAEKGKGSCRLVMGTAYNREAFAVTTIYMGSGSCSWLQKTTVNVFQAVLKAAP